MTIMGRPQENVIEVRDDRAWAQPHYISAKGIAHLHEMVAVYAVTKQVDAGWSRPGKGDNA